MVKDGRFSWDKIGNRRILIQGTEAFILFSFPPLTVSYTE
jgi:hypothetical protein